MRLALIALAALALTACSAPVATGPTAATVTITDQACTVDPVNLPVGDVTFTVHNTTANRVPFVVSEDEGTEQVGEVDVAAGASDTLTVHLDGADEYQTRCGAVVGPEIDPGV